MASHLTEGIFWFGGLDEVIKIFPAWVRLKLAGGLLPPAILFIWAELINEDM